MAFTWAAAMAMAAAGLMVLLSAHGVLAWTLAVAAVSGGALVGAVLAEQRGIHPLALMEIVPAGQEHDAT